MNIGEDENVIEAERKVNKIVWSLFFKQVMICASLWTLYFLYGLNMGAPTVIIPQLRREKNSTSAVSEEMAYWLSSVFGIGALPWVFILPIFLEVFGRKKTHFVVCVVTVCGFVVFYCSYTPVQILISEIILGIFVAASQSMMLVLLIEYTSPEYRGMFLPLKSASYLWGTWVANAIGTFFPWKYIGILAFVCCIYLITLVAWPESPFWLATKGRFVDCAAAHRWLKGTDSKSEEELANLIQSQKRLLKNQNSQSSKISFFKKIVSIWYNKEFYQPMILGMLVILLYYLNGKLVCSMYVIEIVYKITGDEKTAYKTMLILDGVAVLAAYAGSILSKFVNRRGLIITSTSLCTIIQFILFFYLTLIKTAVIDENNIITVTILTIHSVIATGGNIMCSSVAGEMFPLQYISWAVYFMSLYTSIIHFITLRIAPELFKAVGLNITFLIYSLGSSVCIIFTYKYLPETKDKTLNQIAEYFKDPKVKEESNKLMS